MGTSLTQSHLTACRMALAPDLVALVHRVLEDEGPDPGLLYHDDADYDAIVARILADHEAGSPAGSSPMGP